MFCCRRTSIRARSGAPDLRRGSLSAYVEVAAPRRASLDFRLSLPNGVVLEWSGSELPSPVVELVERLAQSR